MFPVRPRPAVPSKGALRVLYQLAYISSGAALGVGVLCAEERRRRVKIIQRIADNARLLRQSPRYAHNAAAAASAPAVSDALQCGGEYAEEAVEHGRDVFEGKDTEEESRRKKRERRNELRRRQKADAAWVVSEMPSVVEREDHELEEEEEEKKRLYQWWSESPAMPESHLADDSGSTAQRKSLARRRKGRVTLTRVERPSFPPQIRFIFTPDEDLPLDGREQGTEVGEDHTAKSLWTGPQQDLAPVTTNIKSRNRLSVEEDITRDTDQFFIVADTGPPSPTRMAAAIRLLERAVQHGALQDIRSLVLWKISQRSLSDNDILALCHAAGQLGQRIGGWDLLDFYANLLNTPSSMSPRAHARMRLMLIMETSNFRDVDAKPSELFNICLPPSLSNKDNVPLCRAVKDVCRYLLRRGKINEATQVFYRIGKWMRIIDADELADNLFTTALKMGSLSASKRMLRWNRGHRNAAQMSGHVDEWVAACAEQGAWSTLSTMFSLNGRAGAREHMSRLITERLDKPEGHCYDKKLKLRLANTKFRPSELSSQSLVHLATALAHTDDPRLARSGSLLRGLPLDLQRQFAGPDAKRISAVLKMTWESTRNFQVVRQAYRAACNVEAIRENMAASAHLQITFAEICILAKKPELAIDAIRGATNKSDNAHALLLAAFVLARQGRWGVVHRVLITMKDRELLRWSYSSQRIVHQILNLYCIPHTADELWNFATALVAEFKFPLRPRTTKILLQGFVQKGAIEMIPRWIRYVRTILGKQYSLIENTGSALIEHWYLTFRPSHRELMLRARELTGVDASFTSDGLQNLVNEAWAYDLRHYQSRMPRTNMNTRNMSELERIVCGEDRGDVVIPPPQAGRDHKQRARRDEEDETLDSTPSDSQMLEALMHEQRIPGSIVETFSSETPGNGVLKEEDTRDIETPETEPSNSTETPTTERKTSESAATDSVSSPSDLLDEPTSRRPEPNSLVETLNFDTDENTPRPVEDTSPDTVNDGLASPQTIETTALSRSRSEEWPDSDISLSFEYSPGVSPLEKSLVFVSEGIPLNDEDVIEHGLVPDETESGGDGEENIELDDHNSGTSTEATGDPLDGTRGLGTETSQSPNDAQTNGVHSSATPDGLSYLKSHKQTLETRMKLALTLKDYEKVLWLYTQTLDAKNIPASPRTLEIAVYASLRRNNGNSEEADQLMLRAEEAGMNVTCAMGPILINQMRQFDAGDLQVIRTLRLMVMEYYRRNEADGWPVSHYVANSAANRLIKAGRPYHAINLLDDVFRSHWAAEKAFEADTMAEYIKAFTALRDFDSVARVIQFALASRVRTDWRFDETLRDVRNKFAATLLPRKRGVYSKEEIDERLVAWRAEFKSRSEQRKLETVAMGTQLVSVIREIVEEERSPHPVAADTGNAYQEPSATMNARC